MNDMNLLLDALRRIGRTIGEQVQARADNMTGTELYAEEDYIPDFRTACEKTNMLDRPVGFVCRSSAGRVVRLLQVYDSDTYTAEPEELPAQWGYEWSTDPAKALPFIALATSPYNTGDCCTADGHVWRSGQDANVRPPDTPGVGWDDLGPIEDWQ